MSGRRQQDAITPKPIKQFGICSNCSCDYRISGALESYDMQSGLIKTLCHCCALKFWSEIIDQN
ncbi:MAG: hypothetical protein QM504_17890 [Pseudomonadota bacterium]